MLHNKTVYNTKMLRDRILSHLVHLVPNIFCPKSYICQLMSCGGGGGGQW